jgi:hypothetical protein
MMWIASQVMYNPAGKALVKSSASVKYMTPFIKKMGLASYKYKNWYSRGENQAKMKGDVERTVRSGVPAIVGTLMYKLPSQAAFSNQKSAHWVSIVAYDANYYYYIDTCWGVEQCGGPGSNTYDPYNQYGSPQSPGLDYALGKGGNHWGTVFHAAAGDDPRSLDYRATYPGTWRIRKDDMYTAITAYKAGGGWWQR